MQINFDVLISLAYFRLNLISLPMQRLKQPSRAVVYTPRLSLRQIPADSLLVTLFNSPPTSSISSSLDRWRIILMIYFTARIEFPLRKGNVNATWLKWLNLGIHHETVGEFARLACCPFFESSQRKPSNHLYFDRCA